MRSHIFAETLIAPGKGYGSGSPYKSHDTLGNHSTIEYRACQLLALEAACHHGRLRCMEARYGAAGYAHKHHREHRVRIRSRMAVEESF